MEKFREVLETEYLERKLVDCDVPRRPPAVTGDHIGVHEQKDGKFYVGVAPVVGRIDGEIAGSAWPTSSRSTAPPASASRRTRSCVVLGVDGRGHRRLVADLDAIGLSDASPSNWRRNTMACTGIEFCKLAIVETKERAARPDRRARAALPRPRRADHVNVNGCPNACARTQVADIGLKGQLVMDETATRSRASRSTSAARSACSANFGRKLRAHKVTSAGSTTTSPSWSTTTWPTREDDESFADLGRPAPTTPACAASTALETA